jgi:hypothetical protein
VLAFDSEPRGALPWVRCRHGDGKGPGLSAQVAAQKLVAIACVSILMYLSVQADRVSRPFDVRVDALEERACDDF